MGYVDGVHLSVGHLNSRESSVEIHGSRLAMVAVPSEGAGLWPMDG